MVLDKSICRVSVCAYLPTISYTVYTVYTQCMEPSSVSVLSSAEDRQLDPQQPGGHCGGAAAHSVRRSRCRRAGDG